MYIKNVIINLNIEVVTAVTAVTNSDTWEETKLTRQVYIVESVLDSLQSNSRAETTYVKFTKTPGDFIRQIGWFALCITSSREKELFRFCL